MAPVFRCAGGHGDGFWCGWRLGWRGAAHALSLVVTLLCCAAPPGASGLRPPLHVGAALVGTVLVEVHGASRLPRTLLPDESAVSLMQQRPPAIGASRTPRAWRSGVLSGQAAHLPPSVPVINTAVLGHEDAGVGAAPGSSSSVSADNGVAPTAHVLLPMRPCFFDDFGMDRARLTARDARSRSPPGAGHGRPNAALVRAAVGALVAAGPGELAMAAVAASTTTAADPFGGIGGPFASLPQPSVEPPVTLLSRRAVSCFRTPPTSAAAAVRREPVGALRGVQRGRTHGVP